MRAVRSLAARRGDVLTPLFGAVATLIAAWLSVHRGATMGVGLAFALAFFLAAVMLFLFLPHVAVAAMIPIFAATPALKLFVSVWIGPLKDAMSLAAIVAATLLLLFERKRPHVDRFVAGGVATLLGIYVVNAGGGHGIAWVQGVRLVGEPLLLLIAGMVLLRPGRTLRWAMVSLIATSVSIAAYGLLQQALGQWRLVALGYSFDAQVRTYAGHLRSFGTLDDSFVYAALLMLGAAAVVFWMRWSMLYLACLTVIALGVAVSYERTALLIGVGLVALLLARFGLQTSAALFLGAAVAVAVAFVITSSSSESRSYRTQNSVVTLNGRVAAWQSALGTPMQSLIGQGVGNVGTAAQRASTKFVPTSSATTLGSNAKAVDSGYFAAIADVGLLGLAVLLALLGRLCVLSRRAIQLGGSAGWLAAGLLAVVMLDASTRSSFTGFPTAFLAFPLIGIALAAANERAREESPPRARRHSPVRPRPWPGARAPAA